MGEGVGALNMAALPKDRQSWAGLFLALARIGLGFYLLLAPFGTSFREIGGVVATASIALYYVLDWRGSVLRRHPLRWVFAALLAIVVLKTVHTTHFSLSWYALRHCLHSSFFLGVAGLESVRQWRHVRALLWCAALMILGEGLTGVWQGVTGRWPGEEAQMYVTMGRLVGTMETPRVGNLLSLLLPAAMIVPFAGAWPKGGWRQALLALLLCAPGIYLLLFSWTRSAWVGFAVSLVFMLSLRFGRRFTLTLLAVGVIAVLLLPPGRFSVETITSDQRWVLWKGAIDVFCAFPFLGSGINTYGDAIKDLGITFDFAFTPHPHNIYLQALSETGIVGGAALLAFLGGSLWFMLRPLWRGRKTPGDPRRLMALAWASAWAGYLVTAVSAHSFYRTWWLGLALIVQGVGLASARLLAEDGSSDLQATRERTG